jgi:hypothetical protein
MVSGWTLVSLDTPDCSIGGRREPPGLTCESQEVTVEEAEFESAELVGGLLKGRIRL